MIDTNLLVYLVDNSDAKKHQAVKEFFEAIQGHRRDYFISTQNLREFSNTMVNKTNASIEKIQLYLTQFYLTFNVLHENVMDSHAAIALTRETKTPFWDALLSSTAKRHEIKLIYTENTKDFERIPGIKVINPFK